MSQFDIDFEDYEVLPGADLSPDDEACLIDTLKVSVNMLNGFKGNKRKTLKYCNDNYHLPPGKKDGPFTYQDDVFFLPKVENLDNPVDGEFVHDLSLNGKIFLFALFSLIKQEKYQFGYVWNFLNDELYERRITTWHFDPVSENAIKFALKFDYESLASYVRDSSDVPIKDRIREINRKLTDCKGWSVAGMSPREKTDLIDPMIHRLELLVEEAKSELDLEEKKIPLYAGSGGADVRRSIKDEEEDRLKPEDLEGTDAYFNTIILGYDDPDSDMFSGLEILKDDRQEVCSEAFRGYLSNCFKEYLNGVEDESVNIMPLYKAANTISELFRDYTRRINDLYQGAPYNEKISELSDWLNAALECLDSVFGDYCDDPDPIASAKVRHSAVFYCRNFLMSTIFETFLGIGEDYFAPLFGSFYGLVLYNIWNEPLDKTTAELRGKVGLSPEESAKVYQAANIEWMTDYMKRSGDQYVKSCNYHSQHGVEVLPPSVPTVLLRPLFSDFADRLFKELKRGKESEMILLHWLYFSMESVFRLYMNKGLSIDASSDEWFDLNSISVFYINDCLGTYARILSDYLRDAEDISRMDFPAIEKVGSVDVQQTGDDNSDGAGDDGPTPIEGTTYVQAAIDKYLDFYQKAKAPWRIAIKDYLIKHVGFTPGERELAPFAALEDLSLAKVPAYVDFKLMFPGYIGKSKENIYCRYLGNAGKLRKSFRTSRKHISEVNSAVREFGSLLGIPIEKYLI